MMKIYCVYLEDELNSVFINEEDADEYIDVCLDGEGCYYEHEVPSLEIFS
jgi:hypothetical protein